MIVGGPGHLHGGCARYFVDFLKDESCETGATSAEGLKQMLGILTRICVKGTAGKSDIELLEELGSIFGPEIFFMRLRTSAPNPVLTSMLYFQRVWSPISEIENVRPVSASRCFTMRLMKKPCKWLYSCVLKKKMSRGSHHRRKERTSHFRSGEMYQMRYLLWLL